MERWARFGCGVVLAVVLFGGSAAAQERVTVTANDLIQRNHVLEVTVGTEVVWGDPHVDRVWFPSGSRNPQVERSAAGFRAVFERAGEYRGAFTLVSVHGATDVYQMRVVVRPGK
jgi:hypothetical protein